MLVIIVWLILLTMDRYNLGTDEEKFWNNLICSTSSSEKIHRALTRI